MALRGHCNDETTRMNDVLRFIHQLNARHSDVVRETDRMGGKLLMESVKSKANHNDIMRAQKSVRSLRRQHRTSNKNTMKRLQKMVELLADENELKGIRHILI